MRKLSLIFLVLATVSPAIAAPVIKISRVSSTDQRLNVVIENAPVSAVIRSLELHLTAPVMVETGGNQLVSYRASRILPNALLDAIVKKAGLTIESRGAWLAVRDPKEPTVTLDVKDAEVGVILRAIKEQCGIRNLMMDPEIKDRKGTFLFNEVPCTLALNIVFDSLGLSADLEPNSVLNVELPR